MNIILIMRFSRFYTLIILILVGIIANVRDVLGGEPTCSVYIGRDGVCSNYIGNSDYIYLNGTVELRDIENSLGNLKIAQGLSLLNNASIPCVNAFTSYVCAVAYPKCLASEPKSTQPQNVSISLPCKSTCQNVQAKCSNSQDKVVLSYIQTSFLYPINCSNTIRRDPPLNVPYPTSNCNKEDEINFAPRCFPPLIEGTSSENSSEAPNYCNSGCCLPCPQSYFLYPKGYMDKGFLVAQIVRAISSLTSLIVMISYIILPGKRNHPNSLILYASVSIFLYSSIVFFSIGDPGIIQCVNDVDHSTQSNNLICAIQGALLIFASHATAIWVGVIILNLHMHTVWNSNFLSNKQIWLNCFGWGIPLVLTVIALVRKSVEYQFGTLCLVRRDVSGVIFFYPLAVIVVPSFIIHIITFLHIAKIARQAERPKRINSNFSEFMSHKKHVLQAVKIQWRALLLAIILVGTVIFYWVSYFVELTNLTTYPHTTNQFENKWIQCVQSGLGQNECSKISREYMPSYGLLIATELIASLIGIWLFILFANNALWQDWRLWISEKFNEKYPDQFFAI